jgi:hypothetical protein
MAEKTSVTEVKSNSLLDCPHCPDQGWWVDADKWTGEPVQVQCEFCWTNPRSKFNGQSND